MKLARTRSATAALCLLAAAPAVAEDNFNITVDANGETGSVGTVTLEEFADLAFRSSGLQDVNAAYDEESPADVRLDFRGLDIFIRYPTEGGTVELDIPDLDVLEVFDAAEIREANEDALETYLETDEDGTLSRILAYLIAETATDPVAGNPASLQAQMIAQAFGLGTGLGGAPGFDTADPDADEEQETGRRNIYGLGARLGRYQIDGNDIDTIELPFTLVRPLSDPRFAVVLDLPLTYTETNGAESVSAALGVGMRLPVTTNWSLTPSIRLGAVGSADLGSLAVLYGANLASRYEFGLGATEVTIGNMLSYIAATGASRTVDDFEIDYDLQNTVSRNGLGVSGPLDFELFGLPTTWALDVVNTRIFGDDVFIDDYTDIALSVGSKASRNGLTWDSVRLGVTYTVGAHDFEAVKVNFGYQF